MIIEVTDKQRSLILVALSEAFEGTGYAQSLGYTEKEVTELEDVLMYDARTTEWTPTKKEL
jgi:hypothetical protein|tara:strand:- start:4993 stop:5175 length:183 start_codon:yes stop_codon:yes gene_type:complete